MRGASALADLLRRRAPGAEVLVVWEPVLPTDRQAPATPVTSLFHGLRVIEYWDPGRLVSAALVAEGRDRPALRDDIDARWGGPLVWDFAGVFSEDARWRDALGGLEAAGSPVIDHLDTVAQVLAGGQAGCCDDP